MDQQLMMQWLPVFIMIGVATILVVPLFVVSKLVGDDRPLYSKLSPYESGNEPEGLAQENVSIHYSLVAVLFILFDIEIIFMYPWAMTIDIPEYRLTGIVTMGIFVLILAVGYFFAWSRGVFEWK